MPQDPNIYGQVPPRKKQKKEINLPSSLAFTSELSSLLAASSSSKATAARPRPSKSKTTDIFSNVKIKRKVAPNDDQDDNKATYKPSCSKNKLNLRETLGTEDEKAEFEHAKRRMESKARLYAAMQRGDYIGKEMGLVDFDRKWAQKQEDPKRPDGYESSSGDDSSDNEDSTEKKEELIEYTDEFGRVRLVTPSQKARMEARVARGQASALELETMSGRPVKAPTNLIFGDAVQTEAFEARDAAAMEELARKRDRSATPPPLTHYDADKEIRIKGVGFFNFSKDEEERAAQMKSLEAERERTLKAREEKQAKEEQRKKELEARKKELEERRRLIGEKRAKKLAENFLDGLGEDLLRSTATSAGPDTASGSSERSEEDVARTKEAAERDE
ncbi:hypothetical protein QBC37DRAFT_429851 [Rhypophila decipiens]|uniref:Uncharacterized protein n=1 Tax=Rhypophila decipiens TaxID=261697 RepID=A0AAN6Y040_9PEZI|nr:hypothetical protein QBC37DRAFT_429851 [Rhypophila decipiens]